MQESSWRARLKPTSDVDFSRSQSPGPGGPGYPDADMHFPAGKPMGLPAGNEAAGGKAVWTVDLAMVDRPARGYTQQASSGNPLPAGGS